MSAISTPTAAPERQRNSGAHTAPIRDPGTTQASPPSIHTHGRGGRVLFEVPFASAMSDSDLALLGHVLDLWTQMYPKMRPDPNSPGVARLDHFSGLFLEHGADDGQWVLQARTWGVPARQSVHEWHVLAAQAARQLDPHVTLPERLPDSQRATTDRPLGEAANKRLARLRHRLVGLS